MSERNNDREGRFRNKTVAFRVSAEEVKEIESLVAMAGTTKQDYLISRVLVRDIHVIPTIRVQKTMTAELQRIASELSRLSDASEVGLRLQETSEAISGLLREMRDKGMVAEPGQSSLKGAEECDLRRVLPGGKRRVPIEPEKVTPARRRRKVPKDFFKG